MTREQMPQSERGNALMVSLVFLVILTTLGVSVASTGRLELMMAANTQFGNQAYQASESGIDSVMRIPVNSLLASPAVTPRNYYFNPTSSPGGFINPSNTSTRFAEQVNTTTTYVQVGNIPGGGYSLDSEDKLVAHHFTINSNSQAQRGGQGSHQQGMYVVGPN
jgi:Tfp pilus assembly protein PilX